MAETPRVSVIVPTYNRAELLPRAVQSVLSQDFTDLELLIVDDGSTDNTAEVVRELQAQDDRVRYLKLQENRGVGFARDIGLRYSHGEFIAWIDADDIWLPGKLEKQVEALDARPDIEILFTDFWNANHIHDSRERSFVQNKSAMQRLETHIEGKGETVSHTA